MMGVSTESVADTVGPAGGVADAVAVLSRWPASTSAWVSVYVAVQVVLAPGARSETGQLTGPVLASLTPIPVRVTLPVFATRNVYGTVEPTVLKCVPTFLAIVTDGLLASEMSVLSPAVTEAPVGGSAVTDAVLVTCPASTSDCVTTYVAVQVVCPPGASVFSGQLTVPTSASSTTTFVSVTLPVFVTTKLYGISAPTVAPLGAPACLSRVMLGVDGMSVSFEPVAVTAGPDGGRAEAVAMFGTWPASTSAWLSVYVAVQITTAPGASVVDGQYTEPTFGSLTLSRCSVAAPLLDATNEYWIVEPCVLPDGASACLSSVRTAVGTNSVSVESVALTGAPIGGLADTLAVLSMSPRSTSDWVMV